MRGLACVLMFQTHCYDAWLSPEARKTTFFMYSQLGGTLPAPLFLFLAGISFALVTDKLIQKGVGPGQIAKDHHPARRGDFRAWASVPIAGIPDRMGMGAVERFVSRRHSEHDRRLHDADGNPVLDCARAAGLGQSDVATRDCRSRKRHGDRPSNASVVDHVETRLAALADRILHQWRPQPGSTASLAVSDFSLDCLRICRAGGGIRAAECVDTTSRGPRLRVRGTRGHRTR